MRTSTTARIVPDLVISGADGTPTPGGVQLFDLKTIAQCPTRYPKNAVVRRRDGHPSPVDLRAGKVHQEYVKHAEYADRTYCGIDTDTTSTGPFRDRLADLGTVTGLVLGHYAEASDHLHRLIHRTAEKTALATGLGEGARSIPLAIAAQKQRIYKTLSIVTHRARAGLIFKGLEFVGNVRASAGLHRENYHRQQAFRDRQAAYQTAGGPFCYSSRPTFWSRGNSG